MTMHVVLETSERILRVPVSERLDLSACPRFHRAADLLDQRAVERVVVDLQRTRHVFDSGVALLMMLLRRAEVGRGHVTLANCRPAVRPLLERAGIRP